MKILLIEDNISISNVLRLGLEAEMFVIDTADDGEKGSYLARINKYDLIILDNMLPKKNAKQVCSEIREQGIFTPILLLSAKTDTLSKIELLNSGADDYMTKPFSFEELKSRIKALLRRPRRIEDVVLKSGPYELNTDTHEVKKNGKKIRLTKKEFSLLHLLMQNSDRVVSRAIIMEHVWDMESDPFSNTIEAHIRNLRKKLTDSGKRFIQNVPGCGYKMIS